MAEEPIGTGDGRVKWVSTKWLAEHMNDEDVVIIDAQPNIHDYINEHIPGARYFNEGLLRIHEGRLPAMYVDPDEAGDNFRRVGIGKGSKVVVYTDEGSISEAGEGLGQTMVAFSMVRFGHDKVHVLDGGLMQWKKEGRDLTKEFPDFENGDFKESPVTEWTVSMDEVKVMKERDDVILLDARPAFAYEGQAVWPKPGHIPGAVNLPWRGLMHKKNPTLLRPDEDIRRMLADKGATPDKTIICSCGTSREATNEFILLKWRLGYDKVKIYEGSFTEWSSYPENPTVTGPRPR